MKQFLSVAGILVLVVTAFVLGRHLDDLVVIVPDNIRVKADTARVYALACVYVDRAGEPHPVYEDPELEIHNWLHERDFKFKLFEIGPPMVNTPIPCTAHEGAGHMNFGELVYWR